MAAAPTRTILPLPRRAPLASAPTLLVVYAPSLSCPLRHPRPGALARLTAAQANVRPLPSASRVLHRAHPARQCRGLPSPFPFPGVTPGAPARAQEHPTVSSFAGQAHPLALDLLRSAWPASARYSSPVDRSCHSRCCSSQSSPSSSFVVHNYTPFLSPGPDQCPDPPFWYIHMNITNNILSSQQSTTQPLQHSHIVVEGIPDDCTRVSSYPVI